jgi:hypothetical protein
MVMVMFMVLWYCLWLYFLVMGTVMVMFTGTNIYVYARLVGIQHRRAAVARELPIGRPPRLPVGACIAAVASG